MLISDAHAGIIFAGLAAIYAAVVGARAAIFGKRIDESSELRKGYQADIKELRAALEAEEARYAKLRSDFELRNQQYWELYERYAKERINVIGSPFEVETQIHALQTYSETVEAEFEEFKD